MEYSFFSMFCWFPLYSKVNQLYVYIHPVIIGFPSYLGHRRALSRVPCAIHSVLVSILCVCAKLLSRAQLSVTPWTVACPPPLSIGCSRQDYWSGLPFPFPGDLPDWGIQPESLASPELAGTFFTTEPPGKPLFFRLNEVLWGLFWASLGILNKYLFFILIHIEHFFEFRNKN